MQLVNSSVQHLPHTTITASYVSSWPLYLLPPWVEIAAYFGRAENSNVIGEELSEILKFPALEIYCFKPLIVFVLTSQERIKNNNTEQYLYCSQIQVAFRDTFSLGFKKKRR